MLNKEFERGGWLDDVTAPQSERFAQQLADHLTREEGSKSTVYLDTKGIPTVGIGFNLRRKDAKEMLSKVGADFQAILTGSDGLSKQQQQDLLELTVKDTAKIVRNKLRGVDMANHRWQAVMSLAYNSPELIGEKLVKAIRAGQWMDAAREIAFNSTGGVKKANLPAMRARRMREAIMFLGPEQARQIAREGLERNRNLGK